MSQQKHCERLQSHLTLAASELQTLSGILKTIDADMPKRLHFFSTQRAPGQPSAIDLLGAVSLLIQEVQLITRDWQLVMTDAPMPTDTAVDMTVEADVPPRRVH